MHATIIYLLNMLSLNSYIPYSRKLRGGNFTDGSKMKIPGYNFRGCWLTVQNKNTIMSNLGIIFSQMLDQLKSVKILSCENFPLYGIHLIKVLSLENSNI